MSAVGLNGKMEPYAAKAVVDQAGNKSEESNLPAGGNIKAVAVGAMPLAQGNVSPGRSLKELSANTSKTNQAMAINEFQNIGLG